MYRLLRRSLLISAFASASVPDIQILSPALVLSSSVVMAMKACSRPRLVTSISRGRRPASRTAYRVASESVDWICTTSFLTSRFTSAGRPSRNCSAPRSSRDGIPPAPARARVSGGGRAEAELPGHPVQPERDPPGPGPRLDLGGRAIRQQPAPVDDQDPVRGLGGLLQVVRGEQQGAAVGPSARAH